ncbi:hypothetical protein TcCL_Unassigned03576 [Trypanosoma cruzi]|nr:hypothetical protein TcCL_Unassigned03576 [Trypanosoma cruzi]
MPFFVNANDNNNKQREVTVGHHILATDTTHSPIHSSPSQWCGPPSSPQRRLPLSHASFQRKQSRCVSVIQKPTPLTNRGDARRGHTAPQRTLQALLTTLQCDGEE